MIPGCWRGQRYRRFECISGLEMLQLGLKRQKGEIYSVNQDAAFVDHRRLRRARRGMIRQLRREGLQILSNPRRLDRVLIHDPRALSEYP